MQNGHENLVSSPPTFSEIQPLPPLLFPLYSIFQLLCKGGFEQLRSDSKVVYPGPISKPSRNEAASFSTVQQEDTPVETTTMEVTTSAKTSQQS